MLEASRPSYAYSVSVTRPIETTASETSCSYAAAAAPAKGLGVATAIASDIKLAHSVFALPFALLGAGLAALQRDSAPGVGLWLLILLAMVSARTYAMAMNRWLDARLDAANPRTAGRAVPSGQVSPAAMAGTALGSAAVLLLAAAGFGWIEGNWWPVLASPLVLLVLGGYALTKRVTWACHVVLGIALAMSPVAAALAIEPSVLTGLAVWLLAVGVLGWVAGFDVMYALQDIDSDRATGVYSMPASLGVQQALWLSRLLHVAAIGCWLGLATTGTLSWLWISGCVVAAGVLVLEHILVAGGKTDRLPIAFGTLNGIIALVMGGLGGLDLLL